MLEREAMAVLVAVPGISYGRREMALRAAGSAMHVLEDPGAFSAQLSREGASAVMRMIRSGGIERTLEELSRQYVHLVMRGESGYPQRLLQISHPPHLLYCWGEKNLDDPFSMAVVGTRKATDYGLFHTRTIARELAQRGMCIVSGLAAGIDAAAHRGALDARGRTVAVLGGALDRLYPEQNRQLMHAIMGGGGSVISEYPLGMPPTRYSFLHRNRIIAGMSLGVLVTEGSRRSGALRTVHDALDCGREVFALPGDVRSEGSQLPHMLIREGAQLITCAQDILNTLTIEPPERSAASGKDQARVQAEESQRADASQDMPRTQPRGLDKAEAAVWQALASGECSFDDLSERTGIAPEELGALLMMLEMDGMVEALAGLFYRLA